MCLQYIHLQQGFLIQISQYKLQERHLGYEWTPSSVLEAQHLITFQKVAIKVIPKSDMADSQGTSPELELYQKLRPLNAKGIMRLIEYFEDTMY